MTHSTTTSREEPNRGQSPTGASGGVFQTKNPLAGMPPYDPALDPTGDQYAAEYLTTTLPPKPKR